MNTEDKLRELRAENIGYRLRELDRCWLRVCNEYRRYFKDNLPTSGKDRDVAYHIFIGYVVIGIVLSVIVLLFWQIVLAMRIVLPILVIGFGWQTVQSYHRYRHINELVELRRKYIEKRNLLKGLLDE